MPASALRPVPYMGVIHVVAEAVKLGFHNGHPEWSNLGQGQPEVGEIAGGPPRLSTFTVEPGDHAYGPVNGTAELRAAVAAHYNRLYRSGKASKYGPANVSIVAGGRLGLSRIFAAIDAVNLGFQTPDYTAYEDLLDYHRHRFTPVRLATTEAERFQVSPVRLRAEVTRHGLGAFLVSNPCNPTGEVIRDAALEAYAQIGRDSGCVMILDEFYSHFAFDPATGQATPGVSAARHIKDVETDPVLILDGLTKNFRYPGWRLGWIVGPSAMIETIGRAASAIDGGPPAPVQRAALEILEPDRADQELAAMAAAFARKRILMRKRLTEMGLRLSGDGDGTFYCWASIADLPPPFNDAEHFFRTALSRRVLTVPGRHFDVDPGGARRAAPDFAQWMRFSFGPDEANMMMGLDRLEGMLARTPA